MVKIAEFMCCLLKYKESIVLSPATTRVVVLLLIKTFDNNWKIQKIRPVFCQIVIHVAQTDDYMDQRSKCCDYNVLLFNQQHNIRSYSAA